MKKLISILCVMSLTSIQASSLISCSPKGDPSISQSFGEIISSLDTLDEDQLYQYGVKVEDFFNNAEYANLLAFLGIKNLISDDKSQQELRVIEDNMKVVQMANQFLFNIARNIPGYEWIYKKIRWQASECGIVDLAQTKNAHEWFYNITSGWLKNNDQWNLSVTFLDRTRRGWMYGTGAPAYARININKKVKSDEFGNIVKEESNPEAIHKPVKESDNIFAPVIDPKTDSSIYQGFYYSSRLINIGTIYSPNNSESLPSNVIDYSMTAMDWVNNKINSGTDYILANQQDNISKWLIDHFEKNPMYLVDDDVRSHTKLKIGRDDFVNNEYKQQVGNQVMLVLLRTCLNREFIYSNKDKDKDLLSYCDADSQMLLSNLFNVLTEFKKTNPDANKLLNKKYTVNYTLDDIYKLTPNTPAKSYNGEKRIVSIDIDGKPVELTINSFLQNYDNIEALDNTHKMNKDQADAVVTFINELILDKDFRELTNDHTALDFNSSYNLSIKTDLFIVDAKYKTTDYNPDGSALSSFKTDTLIDKVKNDVESKKIDYNRARLEGLGLSTTERILITYQSNKEKPDDKLLSQLSFDPDANNLFDKPNNVISNRIFVNAYMFDRIQHLVKAAKPNIKKVYNDDGTDHNKYVGIDLENNDNFKKAMDPDNNPDKWSYSRLVSYSGNLLADLIKQLFLSNGRLKSGIPIEYWDDPNLYSGEVYSDADYRVSKIVEQNSNFFNSFNDNPTKYLTDLMNVAIGKGSFINYAVPSENVVMFGQLNSYGDLLSSNDISEISKWQKFKINDSEKMSVAYNLVDINSDWSKNVINNKNNPDHN